MAVHVSVRQHRMMGGEANSCKSDPLPQNVEGLVNCVYSSDSTTLSLYSHLRTTFLSLRTTFGQQQKSNQNQCSFLLVDFLRNHMVSEHVACSETSAISSSFKPSYIGSPVSCVTVSLFVLLLSYHSVLLFYYSILPPPDKYLYEYFKSEVLIVQLIAF